MVYVHVELQDLEEVQSNLTHPLFAVNRNSRVLDGRQNVDDNLTDFCGFIFAFILSNSSHFSGTMASIASGDIREPVSEQAIANMYAAMRSEMNQLYSKITELEMEVSEHSLVIGAIQPLDPSRCCYRMVGGVLVERTIKEVLPAVQRNKAGLEEVIARLNEALEKKKREIAEFELKHKIKIRRADAEAKDDSNPKEGSAQGVLVGPANE